jgi:glycosyltransferase involved in cell wall biosynthesis
VATDVGACRELIEGGRPEDQALGRSGAVVPIANPEATARAALPLLQDENAWRAAQQAGIRRVETYYTQAGMFDQYRQLYDQALPRHEEAR